MHIVLSGYYGFDNVGDDAIMYAIIQALRKIDSSVEITVLSNNPAATAEAYGVSAVNRWKLGEVGEVLKRCDGLISGGGSLMQDATGLKSVPYYAGIIRIAKFYKKPVFVYAQGMGPINKALSKWIVKSTFNKVDGVSVRDVESLKLLEEIGVRAGRGKAALLSRWEKVWVGEVGVGADGAGLTGSVSVADGAARLAGDGSVAGVAGADVAGLAGGAGVAGADSGAGLTADVSVDDGAGLTGADDVSAAGAAVTVNPPLSPSSLSGNDVAAIVPDPVLGIDASSFRCAWLDSEMLDGQLAGKEFVTVSVRDWPTSFDFKLVIANSLDKIAAAGYHIVFIPMHGEHDAVTSREIATLMTAESIVAPFNISIEEKIAVIGSSKLLIGMRLHSLIFAGIVYTPFIAISYDPKIDSFAAIAKQPVVGHVEKGGWSSADLAKLSLDVIQDDAVYEEIVNRLQERIDVLKSQAELTAQMAWSVFV